MIRKQLRADPQVIVHVGDDALDVVLDSFDRRIGGAEPELLVGVVAEVLGDVEYRVQLGGQSLGPPAGDGLVPPHGPFPNRQPVYALAGHHRSKSFDMVHEVTPIYQRSHSARTASTSSVDVPLVIPNSQATMSR